MNEQFKNDVLDGLSANPKFLSSKYFYDKIGDDLFVQIMNLPEYYLTNAEMDIFSNKTDELIAALNCTNDRPFDIVELGAGDGSKTIKLLERLVDRKINFSYQPVDISQNALDGLESRLKTELPNLEVETQQGEYFEVLSSLKNTNRRKVVLFLGSNIGNMLDPIAKKFIDELSSNLNGGDHLLIGIDLIKAVDIVLPAYNDSKGITAAFNLNVLRRINSELGGDFDLEKFVHSPYYTEEEGIAKSYLKSTCNQEVFIAALDKTFHFEEGETIHTEISRKYNDKIMQSLIQDSGLQMCNKIMDNKEYFADYILCKS
jgi:L-histidine Nalpha-methyltransferase